MSHLREIVLRFDSHDAVVELDKIISVEVEQDIIANKARGHSWDVKPGPHIVTIVVEAENMTAYARPVIKELVSSQTTLPPIDDRPRRLLRRNRL